MISKLIYVLDTLSSDIGISGTVESRICPDFDSSSLIYVAVPVRDPSELIVVSVDDWSENTLEYQKQVLDSHFDPYQCYGIAVGLL